MHNLWSARGLCAPVAPLAPLRGVAVRGHAARGCEGGSDPVPGLPGPGHSGRAGRPECDGVAPTLACRCQHAERVRPEHTDDKSTCWFEGVGHVTNPMQSPSVLPVDPAGPADPASARFASAGQARLRASRFGETREVLEKRRAIDRVSHEDPQAIIIVGSVTSWLANLKSTMREWNRTETLSGATVRRAPLPLTFWVHFLVRLFVEDSTARTGRDRADVPSPELKEWTMTDLPTEWLTVREAAVYSRCGVKTLYRAVQRGELRAARVGGRRKLVLRTAWLDAYLEASADNTPREIVRLLKAA